MLVNYDSMEIKKVYNTISIIFKDINGVVAQTGVKIIDRNLMNIPAFKNEMLPMFLDNYSTEKLIIINNDKPSLEVLATLLHNTDPEPAIIFSDKRYLFIRLVEDLHKPIIMSGYTKVSNIHDFLKNHIESL